MKGDYVICLGELHVIADEAIAQIEGPNGESRLIPVALVAKVECAMLPGFVNAYWTPVDNLRLLVSQIDPKQTEWVLGIKNGLRDAY
jgi:hypothetical protein